MSRSAWPVFFALFFLGCTKEKQRDDFSKPETTAASPPPSMAPPPIAPALAGWTPGNAVNGKKLVETFECSRCHDGTGVAAAPSNKHCITCHQDIITGKFKAPAAALAKWRPNVIPLRDVPPLTSIGKRLKPQWIERFIQEPHDLRPNLVQTMPRLKITAAEAKDIVTYLTEGQLGTAAAPEGDSSAGRELFEAKGCGTCHIMSGVEPFATQPKPGEGSEAQQRGLTLAPDLRFARDRVRQDQIVAWIVDPKSIKPDTLMTPSPLSQRDATNIASYILTATLAPAAVKPIPARLPKLTRKVGFEEVNDRVLMKTCRHCHGDPDSLLGDGGPGNTGGFGFKPRGLNLSHHRGVMSGRLDDKGERESVFTPLEDGTPRLVAALLARQSEEAGKPNPAVRGMPLSLPSLPPEDIQLVETWIAQGRPP